MTTALQLIEDALLEIGIKDEANSLSAEQAQHGVRAFNRLLGKMSQRRLLLPVLSDITIPMTGAGSYTIGPTGATVTANRPIRVESARHVDTIEYPVRVMNQDEWNGIALKTATGGPVSDVWYEATNTIGTLHVYPRASSGSLKINARSILATITSLPQELTFPAGYEEYLVPALADACASSYQIRTPVDVLRRMTAALRAIQNANTEPMYLDVGLARGENFEIERGY